MAKEAIASGRAPGLAKAAASDSQFSSKAVYDLAMQGDEAARKVFERMGRALGICLANLVNALNLPMFVVGGGASSAWDAFSPSMFQELRLRSLVYAATAPSEPVSGRIKADGSTNTIITRALLGSDAGLFGAARLPMTKDN
jgi:glucokinase